MPRKATIRPLNEEQRALASKWFQLALSRTWRWKRMYPTLRDDLEGMAVLGLCRAALAFDPSRGVQFSTYAVAAVDRCIQNELNRKWLKPEWVSPGVPAEMIGLGSDRYAEARDDDKDWSGDSDWVGGENDEGFAAVDDRDAFEAMIRPLKPRQQETLRAMCLDGKSMSDIARERGVSHQRVQQVVYAARKILEERRTA